MNIIKTMNMIRTMNITKNNLDTTQPPHLLAIATLAPNSDIISVIPLPRPVPPPVIKATLPSNAPSGNNLDFMGGN